MLFRKITDAEGPYADASGTRYDVSAARRVRSVAGVNVGYESFLSLEDALKAWGLRIISGELPAAPTQTG